MFRCLRVSFACLVALFTVSSVAWANEPMEINFGIHSTESSQNIKHLWEPLLKRMQEETGYKVNAFFSPDYAGIITAMEHKKVQVAWIGNKSAIEAEKRAHSEIFAKSIDEEGVGGYYSHLIVHKDSSLHSVADVLANSKDLSFSNGDPNSTSGFVVPGYYVFAKNNADPKKIFKRTLNAKHETNILSVANKQVGVATCSSEALHNFSKRSPEKWANIKIIWTSPLIPNDPLVYRKDLPIEVKEKVKNFFLTFGVEGKDSKFAEDKKILKGLGLAPFQSATDDHALPIRQLELFKTKMGYENNTSMDPQEKAAKIQEINEHLAKLDKRQQELNNNTNSKN